MGWRNRRQRRCGDILDHRATPSQIMRTNRPYLFSDSERKSAYRLSESEFRHHLATLTHRNQHKDFEVFCRKLAERTLCPNLRPQTGPEGGGDGKVDTESYPVAAEIAERWYRGLSDAGDGYWGFAFSTKERWTQKVRDDVAGIVDTGRDYGRIVCITSRAARQVTRLALEQELLSSHGVPVTVLDGEWIVEKVFAGGHQDLAYQYLGAGAYEPDKMVLGANDIARTRQLEECEGRLTKTGHSPSERTQAVSDAFEAAVLSRQLERPRIETEGRFDRAIRLAEKYGAEFQQLRAVYEKAWTLFWWFDDVEAMLYVYASVEALAFPSGHAAHVSKVCNLHQVLVGQVARGVATPEETRLAEKTDRLRAALEAQVADSGRPNNALYAETLLVMMSMNDILLSREKEFDPVWAALSTILHRAEGLGEFPADLIDTVVTVLSEAAPESHAFDALVEQVAEFFANRNKEVTAGQFYLDQGGRKLERERPIEAIKWLGRAVVNLSKDEAREDQAKALYFLAIGYQASGLLWAARATALGCAIQFLIMSETEGEMRIEAIPAFDLLCSVSLRLGHVLDALAAHRMVRLLATVLPLDEKSQEHAREQHERFDMLLAAFLVGLESADIARLDRLPDVLAGMGLIVARSLLLYRLGYTALIARDGTVPTTTVPEDLAEMARNLVASLPRVAPSHLVLHDGGDTLIRTKILGVEIGVRAHSGDEGMLLAQTYAGALESFAATLLNARVFPVTPAFDIVVQRGARAGSPEISVANGKAMSILLPAGWDPSTISNLGSFNRHLADVCAEVLMTIAVLEDPVETINELVQTEQGLDRATIFSHAAISRQRVFGTRVGLMADWEEFVTASYPITADASRPIHRPTDKDAPAFEVVDGEPVFREMSSHGDLSVRSVINKALWDDAGWRGLVFGHMGPQLPPILGLIFTDRERGEAIFTEWRDRFGKIDAKDKIRISIIKGIDRHNPSHYRGMISQEIGIDEESDNRLVVNVSRMTTMHAADHRNLDMFIAAHGAVGAYVLAPAFMGPDGKPEFDMRLAIGKSRIFIRAAWEIGAHDLDSMAVKPDDELLIPLGVDNPPVEGLRKWRESRERGGRLR
ncbi:hypothetical protein XM25_04680 [Devosia sp. H5989]|nr:hypothetical protein XM25_04680 [Devosia sp. H5989]